MQVAADETLLTPRFYTTDFDEMERLFSLEINKNLDMEEFDAMLAEFKQVLLRARCGARHGLHRTGGPLEGLGARIIEGRRGRGRTRRVARRVSPCAGLQPAPLRPQRGGSLVL